MVWGSPGSNSSSLQQGEEKHTAPSDGGGASETNSPLVMMPAAAAVAETQLVGAAVGGQGVAPLGVMAVGVGGRGRRRDSFGCFSGGSTSIISLW